LTYISYWSIIVVDMHDKQLYGTATVGTKGQVVIPADARDALDIQTGDRLYVVGSQEKKWVGFIKEEQLRDMLDHITSNIEHYKDMLNK
jgi:AbrB family looped-hinge helix DNA binding protein